MKRTLWIGGLVMTAAILAFFLKGPHVTKEFPFALVPFEDFYIRAQNFSWGLGEEDFQIQVPVGGKLDQISFSHSGFHRERIQLANWGIATTYAIAVTGPWLYLFENSGALLFSGDGSQRIWCENFSDLLSREPSLNGPTIPLPDFSSIVFVSDLDLHTDSSYTEMIRYFPEKGKKDVLLSLPEETDKGRLERFDLPNGFIASRWTDQDTVQEPVQFYGLDGKPAPHPLAVGINLLRQHKMRLFPPVLLSPDYGAFFPSQTKSPWGLFTWTNMPNQTDKKLFLLSVTDTVQAVPVTCDRYSLEPDESLRFLLVNPKYDIFLAGVHEGRRDTNTTLYVGRVRKDPTGKIYRAETYRAGSFPDIASPIFSRNGQVLLFATAMHNRTNLVFARLADIVADVNRRYPDAKFDLDELK